MIPRLVASIDLAPLPNGKNATSNGKKRDVSDSLRILGIDGSTGRPLESLPVAEVQRWAEEARRKPRPPRYGVATGDLGSAGWGAVFAEGIGGAVHEALEPLLARRRRQAGDRFKILTYRADEATTDFRNRLLAGIGRVDPRQAPWYLLLVGDPAELPHGFELDLGVPYAVGRLAFENVEDYAAYAQRVVAAEDRSLRRAETHSTVFAPVHPDDPPTAACAEHLAGPLAELLRRQTSCTSIIGGQATRAALLEQIQAGPDLLVAAGHSTVFGPEVSCQRQRQGAVICADWPGPVQWEKGIPPEHAVAAEDLPPGALQDGIALLFGCHTAGTPYRDVFDGVLHEEARDLTAKPFVAALAQRLLGRDGGALAVVGHVGRAFEASFVWRGVRQIGAFEDTLQALIDGRRLGEALDGFGQRFADLAIIWSRSRMAPEATDKDPLSLWRAFHDARSWSLIGDPAVRLPAATGEPSG